VNLLRRVEFSATQVTNYALKAIDFGFGPKRRAKWSFLAIQFALPIEEIKLARRARWLARNLRGIKRFPATNEANKEGQASSQGKIGRRFTHEPMDEKTN